MSSGTATLPQGGMNPFAKALQSAEIQKGLNSSATNNSRTGGKFANLFENNGVDGQDPSAAEHFQKAELAKSAEKSKLFNQVTREPAIIFDQKSKEHQQRLAAERQKLNQLVQQAKAQKIHRTHPEAYIAATKPNTRAGLSIVYDLSFMDFLEKTVKQIMKYARSADEWRRQQEARAQKMKQKNVKSGVGKMDARVGSTNATEMIQKITANGQEVQADMGQ